MTRGLTNSSVTPAAYACLIAVMGSATGSPLPFTIASYASFGPHAAGPGIPLAHSAIADLVVGKTAGDTGRFQQRPGCAVPQRVPRRRLAELDGVALVARPEAPPVEHDEDHRRGGAHAAGRCHIEGDAS